MAKVSGLRALLLGSSEMHHPHGRNTAARRINFPRIHGDRPCGLLSISNVFWTEKCQFWTENCQFGTEKCQLRTQKCQLRTEKCQLRTEKCQFGTAKCQLRTEKCQLRTEKCQFGTAKCQFDTAKCNTPTWSRCPAKALCRPVCSLACRAGDCETSV
jgi:hypothetical protein